MKYILFFIALAAQAQINVGVLDQIGTSLPGTCSVGQRYTKTDATAAAVLYVCTATNTWTQQVGTGSSSIPDDGLRVSAASGAVRLSTGSRRIGSATYTLSALCDATPSAGTGFIFWYMTAAGVFTAGHNVTATITSGSCSIASSVTTYPQGSMGLGYCVVTSGVVGACTASPQTGRDSISAGNGIAVTGDAPQAIAAVAGPSGYVTVGSSGIDVDTAFVPGKTAANTWTAAQTLEVAPTLKQVTTPSNPAANYDKLYFKSDDKLYRLTSGGTETEVGASSAVTLISPSIIEHSRLQVSGDVYTTTANVVACFAQQMLGSMTIGKMAAWRTGGATSGHGITFAIYDSSGGRLAYAVNSSAHGANIESVTGMSQALTAGSVYYFCVVAEDSSVTLAQGDFGKSGASDVTLYNNLSSALTFFTCTNAATGTGASHTPPATCGAPVALTSRIPWVGATP